MCKKKIDNSSDKSILLNPDDNIIIALGNMNAGQYLKNYDLTLDSPILSGQKIAKFDIEENEPILKYGTIIGFSNSKLFKGQVLTNANVVFKEFSRDHNYCSKYHPTRYVNSSSEKTFRGYKRNDGRVGTRNFIAIVSTVNCSATVVHEISSYFTGLFQNQGLFENENLKTLVMQENGGTTATIKAGIKCVEEMLEKANKFERSEALLSSLMVGLQCGGSDAFSSLSANPALGKAVDILVRHGGTAILSETPEIYGVEHTLTARAVNNNVAEKLMDRVNWWKDVYSVGRDVQINGTVSPGNQKGGLANILEKSLGSAMKGGTTGLMEVYNYAEKVEKKGLVFMDTPGFDPVSATGQIAGGANLVAFTTGRGSCFGAKPTPSIKLATNSDLFNKMNEDMDINCGAVIDGYKNIEQMGEEILQYFISCASGKQTKSEILNLGRHEFAPWQIGITG